MANYKLISQPSGTVISISDAKQHLNLADAETFYDQYIENLILVGQGVVEDKTWRSLLSQQWLFTLDANEITQFIEFTKCPIIEINTIHYLNTDGVLTQFTDYTVDITSEPARIKLNSIPNVMPDSMNALQIEFTAGYSYIYSIEVTVDSVNLTTNLFTKDNHGLKNSDVIEFHDTGTVTGISTGQPYYIVHRTSTTFKVSLTINGDAIDLGGTTETLPSYKIRQVQDIPKPIIQAIKLIVGDYFMHREDSEYTRSYSIPNGVVNLLQPYTLNYFYR